MTLIGAFFSGFTAEVPSDLFEGVKIEELAKGATVEEDSPVGINHS